MGCTEGRSSERWVDFNFWGHQLVIHEVGTDSVDAGRNPVDGESVPVPHFGIVLAKADWEALRDRLLAAGVEFEIEPTIRFEGEVGEQATMFFYDPAGNALEFKSMELDQLFAT
jgi:extradiol dioxygenase family protein